MDAQETRIYSAVIITALLFGSVVIYFIISIIRQQRKNLELYKQNILAEITAIERDRARIAYDLHDELGPMLSSIKLKMNLFEMSDANDKIQMEKINDNFDSVLERMREISYDLTPAALITQGLGKALEEYIHNVESEGLQIDLRFPDIIVMDEQTSVHVYRIAQEIIHNTLKHAKASVLVIDFAMEQNKIIILFKDNGTGFDQQEIAHKGGLGLKSLHSRTQLMRGKMFLESRKGTGTTIQFEIPY